MMWLIVLFTTHDEVEAVPKHWVKDGKCAWPKKKTAAQRLIEKRSEPNVMDYDYFDVRVICSVEGITILILYEKYLVQCFQ